MTNVVGVVEVSLTKVSEIERKTEDNEAHLRPCRYYTVLGTCSPSIFPPHQSLALLYPPLFVVALIWWSWGHVALSVAFIDVGGLRHGWL